MTNFTVTVNGTNYTTTDGSAETTICQENNALTNITIYATGFDTGTQNNWNTSSNLLINVTATQPSPMFCRWSYTTPLRTGDTIEAQCPFVGEPPWSFNYTAHIYNNQDTLLRSYPNGISQTYNYVINTTDFNDTLQIHYEMQSVYADWNTTSNENTTDQIDTIITFTGLGYGSTTLTDFNDTLQIHYEMRNRS